MKIYAPVKDFNGFRNNVRFVDGVGETNNPQLLDWFKLRGYKVENAGRALEDSLNEAIGNLGSETQVNAQVEPNFDDMTPLEIREWMKVNGFGLQMKNIRDKEKLIKIIRG